MAGLTFEQRSRFAEVRCDSGHRFDGTNYPTPEGVCPLCAWPEVQAEYERYQRNVATIYHPHSSTGLLEQAASPALTATSER